MEYYPHEIDIYALEEEVLVAVSPYLNRQMAKAYYVYGLDTNDGRIAAAWRCPNEQAARYVYEDAMRQMDYEQISGQFQYGYIGIASIAGIEYKQGDLRKIGVFEQKDFDFAATLTKKPVLVAKKYHRIANDLTDFMSCAGVLLEEMTALDDSSKPGAEPNDATGISPEQSTQLTTNYPAIAQAASGQGNPISAVEAYQESIEWADAPAEVIVKNEEPIAVRDIAVVEALAEIKAAVGKNTEVTKKGLRLLRPINQQSLTELVEILPPLQYEREDKHWMLQTTLSKETGIVLTYRASPSDRRTIASQRLSDDFW